MKLLRLSIVIFVFLNILSCASNQSPRDISNYSVPVDNFSKTVELLVANEAFLEDEILKINAQNPSVQRIPLKSYPHNPTTYREAGVKMNE